MAESSQDEFSQFPVESIARFLSVCANKDPALVRRSRVPPAIAALDRIKMRLPPPLRSSSPPPPAAGDTSDESAYLEELVSVAVASARQAEDAARQVRATGATARRRMFAISAFGAIGVLTGIAGILGAHFGPDISGLPVIGSGRLALANKDQPAEQRGVVASHPSPETAVQRPPPSDGSPRDLAAPPRTAEPPLASVAAQAPAPSGKDPRAAPAVQHEDAWTVAMQTEPTPPAPAQPAGLQTVEAMLHDNAASIARLQATPVPAEPGRGATSAPAAVRVSAFTPSKPPQLVAAVQALEALTDSAGEPGAPP